MKVQNGISKKYLVTIEDIKMRYNLSQSSKEKLSKRKILPLKKSWLLANICAHLIGDGSIKFRNKNQGALRFYGELEKLVSIQKDFEKLFGKKPKLVKRKRPFETGFKIDQTDTNIVRILVFIGVPPGEKVLSTFTVPKWVMFGDKEVKRAFLRGLCDDELEGLYREKGKANTWHGLKFKMSKKKALLKKHVLFLTQLKELFWTFNIETSDVKVSHNETFLRKDGNVTCPAYFRIANKKENRRVFFKEIGFQREKRKQQQLLASLK